MSFNGDSKINIEALKRWANSLTVDSLYRVDCFDNDQTMKEARKNSLDIQFSMFVALINNLKEGEDWHICLRYVGPIFSDVFIRKGNSAIRIADYYECLLVPSNIKTLKRIVKGFDYTEIGAIHINNNAGKTIASIGMKSDLIWSTFYNYFINEDDFGNISHTYDNHEKIFSIQLFDVENSSDDEILQTINEILLSVSMEYDMNFKIYSVDPLMREEGSNETRDMIFTPTRYEQIPMLYLNNAINSEDVRLAYLSYYQVIEYFFVRSQNASLLTDLAKLDLNNINHNELRKVLNGYKKISNERDALRLVLTGAIDISMLKKWIVSDNQFHKIYCNSVDLNIDLTKDDKRIINALTERVYSFRCSIAHAKGDVDEYLAVPMLSEEKIKDELPLIRNLAIEVIKKWSVK